LASPTPPKCLVCAKFYRHQPHAGCRVCNDFRLEETLLCDLNRRIQKPDRFHCQAFQPRLKLAGPIGNAEPTKSRPTPPRSQLQFLRDFLKSDKIKYQKALALQKLEQDPDGFIISLKYHLLWNTVHRRQVFDPPKAYFGDFLDLFGGFGDLVGGSVALMWLAPDHVHIYVETDGEKSLEAIVKKLKAASSKAIIKMVPDIEEKLGKGDGLWDKAYFLETIG
jgi:putative transposase